MAKVKARNPLRMDPTRTASLRRAFERQVRVRFERLRQKLKVLLLDEDALGLLAEEAPHPFASHPTLSVVGRNSVVNAHRWQFASDPEKIKHFKAWLKTQILADITGKSERELWEAYTKEGLQKGAGRAFDDTRRPQRVRDQMAGRMDFYRGSRDEFLRSSFHQPVAIEKVQLLAARSFDEMEDMTATMATRMTRHLTDGLVRGASPREIARDLDRDIEIGRGRALTIARTEIVRAHAEGQLMALEQLGVEDVGVAVEWSTAGDDHVCELCQPLEGVVLKIDEAKGMLPRHPNCVLPGNTVQGRFTGGLKAWYSGEAVELVTEGACRITLTVNHPILPVGGTRLAGQVNEGDYLLCHLANRDALWDADIEHGPTMIEKVFEAFEPWSTVEVPSSFDLNGDEKFFVGKVDVVSADSFLSKRIPGNFQRPGYLDLVPSGSSSMRRSNLLFPLPLGHRGPLHNFGLALTAEDNPGLDKSFVNDVARDAKSIRQGFRGFPSQIPLLDRLGIQVKAMPNKPGFRLRSEGNSKTDKTVAKSLPLDTDLATERVQRLSGKVSLCQSLLVDPTSIPNGLRLGLASELDVPFRKSISQHPDSYTSFVGQLLQRFSSKVAFRKVVKVRHFHYSGFVYDLETVPGYFTINQSGKESIITENCRCAWIPANVGETDEGQKDTKSSIGRALGLSVERQGGSERSPWIGADLTPAASRPQSQVGNMDYLSEFSKAMTLLKGQ